MIKHFIMLPLIYLLSICSLLFGIYLASFSGFVLLLGFVFILAPYIFAIGYSLRSKKRRVNALLENFEDFYVDRG